MQIVFIIAFASPMFTATSSHSETSLFRSHVPYSVREVCAVLSRRTRAGCALVPQRPRLPRHGVFRCGRLRKGARSRSFTPAKSLTTFALTYQRRGRLSHCRRCCAYPHDSERTEALSMAGSGSTVRAARSSSSHPVCSSDHASSLTLRVTPAEPSNTSPGGKSRP